MALDQAVNSGLENLIMSPEQQQAWIAQLTGRAGSDINQSAGNEAQRVSEAAFGRGMGLSTLNAYAQGQVEQARAKALAGAQVDATSAVQKAQQAALGQAASYLTAQRAQSQQSSQFDRSLKQQARLNTQNLIGGAAAGLGGGLIKGGAQIFAPDIKNGLQGLVKGKPGGDNKPLDYTRPQDQSAAPLEPLQADTSAISSSPITSDAEGTSMGDWSSLSPSMSYSGSSPQDFGVFGGGGNDFSWDPSSLANLAFNYSDDNYFGGNGGWF